MQIGRYNGDASWWCEFGGSRVLFDPWLVGSEVDFAPWFNEAWHVQPCVDPSEARADIVVVSQHYADHCHARTLAELPGNPLFLGVPKSLPAIRRARPGARVEALARWGEQATSVGTLGLWRLSRPWWRPPAYHVIIVADADKRAVVHAPHGLSTRDAEALSEALEVQVLAITRMHYRLPAILGGSVNPGNAAACRAVRACGAMAALPIHDEDKRQKGLVSRLARADRGPWEPDSIRWIHPEISITGTTLAAD